MNGQLKSIYFLALKLKLTKQLIKIPGKKTKTTDLKGDLWLKSFDRAWKFIFFVLVSFQLLTIRPSVS